MDWIVKWAGTLALLRTVGEALKNVDAQKKARPALHKARQHWKRRVDLKSLPIYHRFIDEDANRLLHQAEVRAGQSAMVVAPERLSQSNSIWEDRTSTEPAAPSPPRPVYTYHMNGGPV